MNSDTPQSIENQEITDKNIINKEVPDNTISKATFITVIAVFTISVFIIALFLINKFEWEKKLAIAQATNPEKTQEQAKVDAKTTKVATNDNAVLVDKALEDAAKEDMETTNNAESNENNQEKSELVTENTKLKAELQAFKIADSLRISNFTTMASYKIYGFYRDKSGKQELVAIAKKFSIKSEKAIKIAEVNGEKAYIVPVKGLHIAKNGDTAFSIARKYYKNDKLAKLIEDFNGEIQAGMTVFLPFNQ
jgi:hypothetical protein